MLRRRHRDSHQSRRFTEFRSIQQQQANRCQQSSIIVRTLQSLGKFVTATLYSSQSKGNGGRDTNVVHSLGERETHLQKILERKVDLAVRGERVVRNWEKRKSEIAFREINQEFESQRFQLHQTSRWADQAERQN